MAIPLGLSVQRQSRTRGLDFSVVPDGFEPFAAAIVGGRQPVRITAAVVARFFAKVRTSDDGEHRRWTGSVSSGIATAYVDAIAACAQSVAWVIANRRDIPQHYVGRSTCGDPLCVRHEHIRLEQKRVSGSQHLLHGGRRSPISGYRRVTHEEFVARADVTCVTFRSGGTIVFTPAGHIDHETRIGAIERAIDLVATAESGA